MLLKLLKNEIITAAAAGTLGIRGEKPEDINIQQEKAEASLVMAVVGATE